VTAAFFFLVPQPTRFLKFQTDRQGLERMSEIEVRAKKIKLSNSLSISTTWSIKQAD